ncbi:MAG: hypothetical protein OER22_02195 [Gammaproteobacteria bacterium]|nr:hypothetical protein [Gammaproteobacteria bacterium]MDH3373936.1 hypothetical protein [Gammaproteobacteria bacterium]MDH3408432.1 hypothetical protein [Gammaproteobacteria bacterium]MDH3551405.1 hypothetical protein [Gammaproteobacteria bacterium]
MLVYLYVKALLADAELVGQVSEPSNAAAIMDDLAASVWLAIFLNESNASVKPIATDKGPEASAKS